MKTKNVEDMLPLVHFFEKLVEWLGLSRNAGSILAVLYAERYRNRGRLSLEELAEATEKLKEIKDKTEYNDLKTRIILTQNKIKAAEKQKI